MENAPPLTRVQFVDGPSGTWKTFLNNLLLARVRSEGHVALVVASLGIAALLLDGGRTAHSRFKIPNHIHESSSCNIMVDSDLARLIRHASLFIWDEAPMSHRYTFEAVNHSFQDIIVSITPCYMTYHLGGSWSSLAVIFVKCFLLFATETELLLFVPLLRDLLSGLLLE